jgi:four helix bundle protein
VGHSYQDLIAWQKAMDLAEDTYKATRGFPKDELSGLRSQLRRAVVSVPSNIAEGQGRLTPGEFKQFLVHARGSLLEKPRFCARVDCSRFRRRRRNVSLSYQPKQEGF